MFEDLNVDRSYALLALYFLGREGIGRRKMAEKLGLTESKTRTMLEHLKDEGIVQANKKTNLTPVGKEIYAEISGKLQKLEEVDLKEISMKGENIAALLIDVDIQSSIMIRDEAVRGGARGMTILTYENGFNFPENEKPDSEEILDELKYLDRKFEASEGDKLLVSSAEELKDAKSGLWKSIFAVIDLEHLDS